MLSTLLWGTVNLLGLVGLVRTVIYFVKLAQIIKPELRKQKDLLQSYTTQEERKEGVYAIITGSTSGIGLQFAKELAVLGFDLVCISRNPKKLKDKEFEIREYANKNINLKILNIQKDFSQMHTPGFYEDIATQVENLNIAMLINSAGLVTKPLKGSELLDNDSQDLRNLVVVNCGAQSCLNHLLIPKFVQRFEEKEVKSVIIDVSSLSAKGNFIGRATYGASKGFNRMLTAGLSKKYSREIEWMSLMPSSVRTPMIKHEVRTFDEITPQQCVDGALKGLGVVRETAGGVGHFVLGIFADSNSFLANDFKPVYLKVFFTLKFLIENLIQ